MPVKLFITLFCLAALSACSEGISNGVSVTFRNRSDEDFVKLKAWIFDKEYSFTDVKAGGKTPPIIVDKTYRYCHAEVITNKDTLVLEPICFVGELVKTKGKLRISLDIQPDLDEGKRRLVIDE